LSIHPLLSWFEKRHKSITLTLAQELMSKAIETAAELEKALIACSKGNGEEAMNHISILFQKEKEVDNLRRNIYKELATSSLPWRYREDLLLLIRRLDLLADWVKDSARSIVVLQGTDIPNELVDSYKKIGGLLRECTVLLSGSIEMMGVNVSQAEELAIRVEKVEDKIDKEYLNTKALFIKYGEEINPGTLIVLRDLLEYLERAADVSADTADFLKLLAVGD
jgi:predicted phosphate transport protein (TIGR00153 family)